MNPETEGINSVTVRVGVIIGKVSCGQYILQTFQSADINPEISRVL